MIIQPLKLSDNATCHIMRDNLSLTQRDNLTTRYYLAVLHTAIIVQSIGLS